MELSERVVETVGQRVRKARLEAGLSQRKLGDMIGTTQQAIHDLETKGKGGSSHLVSIANALGVTAEWLWGGTGPKNPARHGEGSPITELEGVAPVIGTVGAGVWREAELTTLATTETTITIPVLPTKTNVGLPQYGLRVEGGSMNKIVGEGEFVAICLIEDGARYYPGDIVVVEKSRNGLFQTTLKRLKRVTADAIVLSPESDDESFTDLIVGKEDDDEARIVAVAIGKYAPF